MMNAWFHLDWILPLASWSLQHSNASKPWWHLESSCKNIIFPSLIQDMVLIVFRGWWAVESSNVSEIRLGTLDQSIETDSLGILDIPKEAHGSFLYITKGIDSLRVYCVYYIFLWYSEVASTYCSGNTTIIIIRIHIIEHPPLHIHISIVYVDIRDYIPIYQYHCPTS